MQEGRQPERTKAQDHAAHPGTDKTVLNVVMTSIEVSGTERQGQRQQQDPRAGQGARTEGQRPPQEPTRGRRLGRFCSSWTATRGPVSSVTPERTAPTTLGCQALCYIQWDQRWTPSPQHDTDTPFHEQGLQPGQHTHNAQCISGSPTVHVHTHCDNNS